MDLKTYRQKMGWTQQQAAAFLSVSNESVWRRYETGERWPRPDVLETILRLTAGAVTAEDMLKTRRAWEKSRDAAERKQSACADQPQEETVK